MNANDLPVEDIAENADACKEVLELADFELAQAGGGLGGSNETHSSGASLGGTNTTHNRE
jgi:hypothetical protein